MDSGYIPCACRIKNVCKCEDNNETSTTNLIVITQRIYDGYEISRRVLMSDLGSYSCVFKARELPICDEVTF